MKNADGDTKIFSAATVSRVEERAVVQKAVVEDGLIEIRTTTEVECKNIDTELRATTVEITRVPFNTEVPSMPGVRTEGDLTIIPIVEERLVTERRLFLVEEVHVRRMTENSTTTVGPINLRRQRVEVFRIPANNPRRSTMSNVYSDITPSSEAKSASTLTAMFENRADAEAALKRLEDAGIPEANIRLTPGYESDNPEHHEGGFWESLKDFFMPQEDQATYSEGLRRGGFLVSVSDLNDTDYATAHDILDDEGSIDLDERADSWRSEGWNPETAHTEFVPSANADRLSSENGVRTSEGTETIPVVEENLRVGKRDVNNGSVRVRSYTVENPVSADVTLSGQNVTVDRRPVNRPLADTDRAFEDRTIAAEEHHEEAVVSKEARVVEEIELAKRDISRTETVNDTVRKTEVEVEDQRAARDSKS